MSNLVIVAIPKENDYVWKISSEKKPHMTLLFLGEAQTNPDLLQIVQFVEHAVKIQKQGPFMMDVDHRGELGDDKADVLFFRKSWDYKIVEQFRSQLLQNTAIKTAYDSVPQFEEWNPHLTLGYPAAPAKKDDRDHPGINWVDFDRIGVWYGDYQGPEYRLEYSYELQEVGMSTTADLGAEFLEHYGVKGMKWGVRQDRHGRDRWDPKDHTTGEDVAKAVLLPLGTGTPAQVRVIRRISARNKVARSERKDQKFAKKANSDKNFVKVHNGAVADLNSGVAKINKKYANVDLTAAGNAAKRRAYDNEVEIMMENAYQKSANSIKSPSGKQQLSLEFQGQGLFQIKAKEVKHAEAENAITGKLIRDATGHIVGFEFDDFVQHDLFEMGEEFLAHYGVKGMRWGQRKDRNSPGFSERARGKHEVKLRAKRPAVDARVQDTIGESKRQKTKLLAKGGEDHPAADDAVRVKGMHRKYKKSGVNSLSNDEIRQIVTRLNLETQLKEAEKKRPKTLGEALTNQILNDPVGSYETGAKGFKAGKRLFV